jgi:hypothetical protein
MRRVLFLALGVILACDKGDRGAAPAVSASAASVLPRAAPSGVPFDPQAIVAACVDRARVHRAAEQRYYGSADRAGTPEREALLCVSEASRKGSGLTPASITACARTEEALAARSLDLWGSTRSYCDVRGQGRPEDACAYDSQCASGRCLILRGAPCGTCAEELPTDPGAPCVVDRCGEGLICESARCLAPKTIGSVCTARDVCNAEGSCVGGKCVPRAKKGEACSSPLHDSSPAPYDKAPQCSHGLDCSDDSHRCVAPAHPKVQRKKIAEACHSHDECIDGYCKSRDDEKGMCIPYNRDGTSCDADEDFCEPPGRCLDGRCVIGERACN